MKLTEIKKKAQYLGIDSKNLKKVELIHAIQTAEGYVACYGTNQGDCVQAYCCFRDDCGKAQK
jgi:hypothetical protein